MRLITWMISGIKRQVHCCSALLWDLFVAEGNYLMFVPWAFIKIIWIEPQSTGQSSGDISCFGMRTLRLRRQAYKTWVLFSAVHLLICTARGY